MSNITTTNNQPEVTESELIAYLDSFGSTKALLPEEKRQFLEVAKAYGLNPFKREIYAAAYGEGKSRQCSIIIGYEVYLKRAERTGLLNGWKTEFSGEGNSLTCTITIYRKDREMPFCHDVFYNEAVQLKDGRPNALWSKMPRTMLRKVAISQGFRLCFSDELGGMPYTDSELTIERDVTEAPPDPQPPTPELAEPDFIKERKELLLVIRKNLLKENPSGLPYFDKKELKKWGDSVVATPKNADGNPELRKISDQIVLRLEELKAEYRTEGPVVP
jgi:phage recombination protein Bet